eukprot:14530973-Alexandrium_andersonii.AAC.1
MPRASRACGPNRHVRASSCGARACKTQARRATSAPRRARGTRCLSQIPAPRRPQAGADDSAHQR